MRTDPCPCSVTPGHCPRSLEDGKWLGAGWSEAGSRCWRGLGGLWAGPSPQSPLDPSSLYMVADGPESSYSSEHWEASLFWGPGLTNHVASLLLPSVGGNGHRSHLVSGGEDRACTSQRKNLQGPIGRTHVGQKTSLLPLEEMIAPHSVHRFL